MDAAGNTIGMVKPTGARRRRCVASIMRRLTPTTTTGVNSSSGRCEVSHASVWSLSWRWRKVNLRWVILSAAIGGFGPGMVSTFIAAAYVTFIVFPTAASFQFEHSYDLLQLGFLIVNGLLVSILSLMLHEARHKSDRERKKALASLDEKSRALQLLDAITEGSTDAIFVKDIDGRYLLFNQAAARFVGKSVQEVLGKDDAGIFPPNQAALIQINDREVMQDNRVTTFQENLDTKDGKSFFLATKGPLHND